MGRVRAFLATSSGRFVLRYLVILGVGFLILALRPVNDHIVDPYTTFVAHEAKVVLNLFGEHAVVRGTVLSSPRFSVAIHNGCNGLEAILIFMCGVLAFPAGWRAKAIGVIAGFVAIQAVNIIRVISLFYIGILEPTWFTATHVFVWQSLIVLFGVVLWLLWVQRYGVPSRN